MEVDPMEANLHHESPLEAYMMLSGSIPFDL
jgi:hypothetical protein